MNMEVSEEECRVTNCALLPLGFLLLICDSYFDLRWVFFPSKETDRDLRNYYTFILRPTLAPVPSPGYYFPFYAMYKLCVQCPTTYNFMLLALFLPIGYRYKGILSFDPDEQLQNWWTIVALRVGLFSVNTMAFLAYEDWSVRDLQAFWFPLKP